MRNRSFDRLRQINEVLMNIDLTYLSPALQALPMQAWIRISTACDLTCPLCERQHVQPVDSGFMDFDRFEKLVDGLAGMRKAHLFGLGEPFLNKRFFEYVEKCHARGIEVSTTTHAMRIDEALARRIVESGMEELAISMDAAEPGLFERLRKGADFHTVCANVRRLSDLKRELGSPIPDLMICCTVSKENAEQLEAMVELASRLGVKRISFSDVTAPTLDFVDYNISGSSRLESELSKARQAGERLGIRVEYFRQNPGPWEPGGKIRQAPPQGCAMAWTNLVVERRGVTRFCCYIKDDLPSAFGLSGKETMNTPGHLANRSDLIAGRIRSECQDCPNRFTNSFEWTRRQLEEAERLIGTLPDLLEADRRRLGALILEYRRMAEKQLGSTGMSSQTQPGGWLKRLWRRVAGR